MASKIKDTPILKGNDAQRFNEKMRDAEKNLLPQKEYERMMAVFKSVRIVENA